MIFPGLYSYQFETGDIKKYDHFKMLDKNQDNEIQISFMVQANHDAHVGIFGQDVTDEEVMYEIVIGGWTNTRSVIRRSAQGEEEVENLTHGLLSGNEYRSFWVKVTANGLVQLGSPDDGVILEWNDPHPFVPFHVGFMTGWGASGNLKVCNGITTG